HTLDTAFTQFTRVNRGHTFDDDRRLVHALDVSDLGNTARADGGFFGGKSDRRENGQSRQAAKNSRSVHDSNGGWGMRPGKEAKRHAPFVSVSLQRNTHVTFSKE